MSRIMAGPWCTQILADLGAEVIKIERPGVGDDTRYWGPPWLKDEAGEDTREAAYYLSANRGKHSVTVDISQPEGRALIGELAAQADVFIENFKTGDLKKKGLGYDALSVINPALIYCSITGFGQTGPMANDAGYDYLIQGMGGLMSVTGVPDGDPGAGPQRVGVAVADLTTGMNSAIAILAALHHRHQSGEGQYIDMALLDTQVSWLGNQALNYFTSGVCPTRTGVGHPNLAPYQVFASRDGHVIIAIGNNEQFARFCEATDNVWLIEDVRFRTNPDRVVHRLELAAEMEKNHHHPEQPRVDGPVASYCRALWTDLPDRRGVQRRASACPGDAIGARSSTSRQGSRRRQSNQVFENAAGIQKGTAAFG